MINTKKLTKSDIGKFVEYKGFKTEEGRIKSWNEKWVFVVYKCNGDWDDYYNYTGCATEPSDLTFL